MEKLTNFIDNGAGQNLLGATLQEFYAGQLGFPEPKSARPYIFANFVTSMDGRITLDQPGRVGGGEISMFNLPDRMLMSVLRAVCGGVIMGANTLRLEPNHIWTARFLLGDQPEFLEACEATRRDLDLTGPMPHFFLTRTGSVLPEGGELPDVMRSEEAKIVFLTTNRGVETLKKELPTTVRYEAISFGDDTVDLGRALTWVRSQGVKNLLCEGGPTVIGDLIENGLLDEVFLTEAPHVVGDRFDRDRPDRKTWVAGYHGKFEQTAQAELVSLKAHQHHIFKRFRFVH